MDLTIEAIEQDLMNAEANAGRPVMAVHLKRAEIRAMLMALPQQFEAVFVGNEVAQHEAAEAAPDDADDLPQDHVPFNDLDSDVDDDFFAEAKRERKK